MDHDFILISINNRYFERVNFMVDKINSIINEYVKIVFKNLIVNVGYILIVILFYLIYFIKHFLIKFFSII